MFHQLASQTKAILSTWALQPRWVASLILLVAVVTLSGPWACMVHCWLIDGAYHRYHLHYHHYAPLDTSGAHAEDTSAAQGMHHPSDAVPTALTIAVVLALSLVPLLLAAAFHFPQLASLVSSFRIPSPRRPPRPVLSLRMLTT
jgi:hypothetical protein